MLCTERIWKHAITAVWSSSMILAQGARGPGFYSQNSPARAGLVAVEHCLIVVMLMMASCNEAENIAQGRTTAVVLLRVQRQP